MVVVIQPFLVHTDVFMDGMRRNAHVLELNDFFRLPPNLQKRLHMVQYLGP